MKLVIWQACSPVQRFDQPYVVHIPANDNYVMLVITGALKIIILGVSFMDKIDHFKLQAKNLQLISMSYEMINKDIMHDRLYNRSCIININLQH